MPISSLKAIQESVGKTISSLIMKETAPDDHSRYEMERHLNDKVSLELHFSNGTGLVLWDGGQQCCEHRYMETSDNLPSFEGAIFKGAEVWEHDNMAFLKIRTDKGVLTIDNYNKHNGYYAGFEINAVAFSER